MTDPELLRSRSLGSTFKRIVQSLILPSNADLSNPPFIFLDGVNGVIRIVGADGSEIELNPNALLPVINFWSEDHTNNAFINMVGTGSVADLGINSGVFTGADGVNRRHRIYMNGSGASHVMEMATIRANNQLTRGGDVTITDTAGILQYETDAGGIQPSLRMDADGAKLNGDLISASFKQTAQFMPTINTSSATFANFGTSMAITKRYTNSRIMLIGGAQAWSTSPSDRMELQMLVNGVGHLVGTKLIPAAGQHTDLFMHGVTPTGLIPSSYTVQVQWRRASGAGALQADANDYMTWSLWEVM